MAMLNNQVVLSQKKKVPEGFSEVGSILLSPRKYGDFPEHQVMKMAKPR